LNLEQQLWLHCFNPEIGTTLCFQSGRGGPYNLKPSKHVFQSFWFGETVSPYEKMCFRSFLNQGHAFHLYTYSPRLEVPRGVQLRDAAELFDRSEYFVYERGRGAGSHAAFSLAFT
jgi:hypothetical protein